MLGDGIYAPDELGTIDYREFSMQRGKDHRGTGSMPLYSRGSLPEDDDPLSKYLSRSLEIEASALKKNQPVTVMIHGFQFDPAMTFIAPPHHHKADNPHARLYHFEKHPLEVEMRHHSTSWPLGLGFEQDDGGRHGLCIAFGWYSNPGFFSSLFSHGLNFYAKAYNEAETAAWQLVCLLHVLTRRLNRPVDLFCHSLGSRVVIRALAQAVQPEPNLAASGQALSHLIELTDRVILLAGAEKVLEAQLMMSRLNRWSNELGGMVELPDFYNITSRENDVLDKLGENFGPAAAGSKQVIGHNGLEALDPSWVDIQLDAPEVAAWFRKRKYTVSGDNTSSVLAVLDHWIHYTWPDNMRVYRDILRARAKWKIADLKKQKVGGTEVFNQVRLMRGPGAVGFTG
jgi:hypothetical protein